MARAVTTQHKTVATIAAWAVAFLIFFPILYTIITSFKSETEAIAWRAIARCRRTAAISSSSRTR